MSLNKLKDLLLFVLTLTFFNLMGPGALLLSVPVFLFNDKLKKDLIFSGILVSGIISFLFLIAFKSPNTAIFLNLIHFFVLSIAFFIFINVRNVNLFFILLFTIFFTFIVVIAFEAINDISIIKTTLTILMEKNNTLPKDVLDSLNNLSKYTAAILSVSESFVFLFNLFIFSKYKKKSIKFDLFKLPEILLPVFLFVAIIIIVTGFTSLNEGKLVLFLYNLLIVLLFFYFINGLSIVVYGLRISKAILFLKVFVYITVFMQPGLMLVTAIGFADFWIDIKSKLRKRFLNK